MPLVHLEQLIYLKVSNGCVVVSIIVYSFTHGPDDPFEISKPSLAHLLPITRREKTWARFDVLHTAINVANQHFPFHANGVHSRAETTS